MPTPVIRYPLDRTGKLPSHLVVKEPHTVAVGEAKIFAPNYGPYFADSLKVYVKGSDTPLSKDLYKPAQMLSDATLRYTKQICALVSIDESVNANEFLIDYQVLGGEYVQSVRAIEDMLKALKNQKKPVYWGSIIGKPEKYPAGPHLHDIGDLYGFEYIVAALEAVRRAILYGSESQFEDLMALLNQFKADYDERLKALKDLLEEHIRNIQNPHGTTKEHVGLGRVENYSVATVTEARNPAVKDRYLTPFLLHEVLKDYSKTTTTGEMTEWGYWRDNSTGYTRVWGRTPELKFGDVGRCYFRRRLGHVFSIVGDTQHRYIQASQFPKPNIPYDLAKLRVVQLKHLMSNRGFGIAVTTHSDTPPTGSQIDRERVVYTWSAEGISDQNAAAGTRAWEKLSPVTNMNYIDNGDGDGYRSGGPTNWVDYDPLRPNDHSGDISEVPFQNGSFEHDQQHWERYIANGQTGELPIFVNGEEPRLGQDGNKVLRLKTSVDQYFINEARIPVLDPSGEIKAATHYRIADVSFMPQSSDYANVAVVIVFFDIKGREVSRSEKWGTTSVGTLNTNAIGRWAKEAHKAVPGNAAIKFYSVGVRVKSSGTSTVEVDRVATDWSTRYFDPDVTTTSKEAPFYNGDFSKGDAGWVERAEGAHIAIAEHNEVGNIRCLRINNMGETHQTVYNQGHIRCIDPSKPRILAASEIAIFSSVATKAFIGVRFYNKSGDPVGNPVKSSVVTGSTSGSFTGVTLTIEPGSIPSGATYYRVYCGTEFVARDNTRGSERVYFKKVVHGSHSGVSLPPLVVSANVSNEWLDLTEQNSYTRQSTVTVTGVENNGQYQLVIQPSTSSYNASLWSATQAATTWSTAVFNITYTGTQDQTQRTVNLQFQAKVTRTTDGAVAYATAVQKVRYNPPALSEFNPTITNLNHLVGVEANNTSVKTAFTWTHAGTSTSDVEVSAVRVITNNQSGSFNITPSGDQFNIALVKSYREKITQGNAQTVTAEYRFRRKTDNKVVTRQVTFRPWIKPPYTYDGDLVLSVTPASQSAVIMSPSETFKTSSFNVSATPANQGIQITPRLVSISNSSQFNGVLEGNQLKVSYTGPNDGTQRTAIAVIEYKATRGDGAVATKTVQYEVRRQRATLPDFSVTWTPANPSVSFGSESSAANTTHREIRITSEVMNPGSYGYTYSIEGNPTTTHSQFWMYVHPEQSPDVGRQIYRVEVENRHQGWDHHVQATGQFTYRVTRNEDGRYVEKTVQVGINYSAPNYGDLPSQFSVSPNLLQISLGENGGTNTGQLYFSYSGAGAVRFDPTVTSGNGGHLTLSVNTNGLATVRSNGPVYTQSITQDYTVSVQATRSEDNATATKTVTVRATQARKVLGDFSVTTNPASGSITIPADGGTVNGQTQLTISPSGHVYKVGSIQVAGTQDVFEVLPRNINTGGFAVRAQANRGSAERSRAYTISFNVRRETDGATAVGTYSLTVRQPNVVVAPPPLTLTVSPTSNTIDIPASGGNKTVKFSATTSPEPLHENLFTTEATVISGDQSMFNVTPRFYWFAGYQTGISNGIGAEWRVQFTAEANTITSTDKQSTYTVRYKVTRRSDQATAYKDVQITVRQPKTVVIDNPSVTLTPGSASLSIPASGGVRYQQFSVSTTPTGHNYSYQGRLVSGDLNMFNASFGNDLRFSASANGTTPYDKNTTYTVEVTATRTTDNKRATRTATVSVSQPRTLPAFRVDVSPTHKNVNLPATGGNHSFNYTFSPSPSAGGYSIVRVDVAGDQSIFTVNIGNDGSLWVDRPHANHEGSTHAREYTLIWHARRNSDGALFEINSHLTVHQPRVTAPSTFTFNPSSVEVRVPLSGGNNSKYVSANLPAGWRVNGSDGEGHTLITVDGNSGSQIEVSVERLDMWVEYGQQGWIEEYDVPVIATRVSDNATATGSIHVRVVVGNGRGHQPPGGSPPPPPSQPQPSPWNPSATISPSSHSFPSNGGSISYTVNVTGHNSQQFQVGTSGSATGGFQVVSGNGNSGTIQIGANHGGARSGTASIVATIRRTSDNASVTRTLSISLSQAAGSSGGGGGSFTASTEGFVTVGAYDVVKNVAFSSNLPHGSYTYSLNAIHLSGENTEVGIDNSGTGAGSIGYHYSHGRNSRQSRMRLTITARRSDGAVFTSQPFEVTINHLGTRGGGGGGGGWDDGGHVTQPF